MRSNEIELLSFTPFNAFSKYLERIQDSYFMYATVTLAICSQD